MRCYWHEIDSPGAPYASYRVYMTDHRPCPRLLARFPRQSYQRLMVWYPANSPIELAIRYEEAADRLRASFRGEPSDDQLFWPWLYLQRHIAELTLKEAILHAGRIRREAGHVDPKIDADRLKQRLKRKFGHRLVPLGNELNRHLVALGLDTIDDQTFSLLRDLGDMDPYGESFRYTDGENRHSAPNGFHVDFPALAAAVEGMNDWLGMTLDALGTAADYYAEMASCGPD